MLTADFWAPITPALTGRPYMIADNAAADSIAGLADAALAPAPPRFSLVAHAMGGFVAFEIMRRAPNRVAKLVLLSTLAPADTPAQTERREGYARLVEEGRYDQVVEERVPILLHPDRRSDPKMLARVRKMAEDTGPERFLKQQRAIMTRADSRPGLAEIKTPTLIVWGREDGITTHAHQEEMHAAIPGAHLEILETCGHLVTLECPDVLGPLLARWLA